MCISSAIILEMIPPPSYMRLVYYAKHMMSFLPFIHRTLHTSFIHVLMYSHYFLSALGIKTWWRRYLTQLQLIQFTIIFTQVI